MIGNTIIKNALKLKDVFKKMVDFFETFLQ